MSDVEHLFMCFLAIRSLSSCIKIVYLSPFPEEYILILAYHINEWMSLKFGRRRKEECCRKRRREKDLNLFNIFENYDFNNSEL